MLAKKIMFLMVFVLVIGCIEMVSLPLPSLLVLSHHRLLFGFVKLKKNIKNSATAMLSNCRLHHGDNGGGAEEGGGQAEGPHPLTGGAVAVRDLCLIILSYVSGRGADEGEKGYGK